MDASILKAISSIAPAVGKSLLDYFGKKRDVSSEEIMIVLLSKVLENDTQILKNQEAIISSQHSLIDVQKEVCILAKNHSEHEAESSKNLASAMEQVCTTLRDASDAIVNLRGDLIRSRVIK